MDNTKYENLYFTDDFYIFLEKFKIKSDNNIKPTHTSMGTYRGSFNIPEDQIDTFYRYYKILLKKNKIIPGILEVHLEQGPIIIDLDFKYYISTSVNQRLYSEDLIKHIVKIYNEVIMTYLDLHENDMHAYILEKKEPTIKETNDINCTNLVKDGIHLIYPFICTNNIVQQFFRELVVIKVIEDNIFNNFNLENNIADVFDIAVIERNNWLLYGSNKDGQSNNLYKLTKIFDYQLNNVDLIDNPNIDINDLPRLLSIRQYKTNCKCTKFVDNISIDIIEQKYNNLLKDCKIHKNKNIIRIAKILTNMLSINRAKSYLSWIEVGFCLHNIDLSLLDEWIEFSKKSINNFKEGECEKCWQNFKYDGYGIGSLYRWAKEDNREKYIEFQFDELNEIFKSSLDGTSYSISKVFHKLNEYNYKFTNDNKWYEFDNHRWIFMKEPHSIIKKLNEELSNDYNKLGSIYNQKSSLLEGQDKKNLMEKSLIAHKISKKIHEMGTKNNIIKELYTAYNDNCFLNNLDENKFLICFKNGIYDLENNYFRNGKPEDNISFSTNINYMKYDPNNTKIKEVYNFFEQIQPEEEIRNYLLLYLSSFLDGIQRDQKFEIWTGAGGNGKGKIIKLLMDSFGDYATTLQPTFLTKSKGPSSSASPELMNTKGKRVCIFQEPENDDKIYVGNMKSIVGGDKIQARALFGNPVEFYPQFKTILACNKLPDIPSTDGGTWRRIRVLPFEINFVDNPKLINERKTDKNLDNLIKTWSEAFMSILIHKYQEYRSEEMHVPLKVLKYTNEYQENSNMYLEYFRENFTIADKNDFVTYDEVWNHFSTWSKDSCPTRKKLNKNETKIEFEGIFGKIKNKFFYGFKFIEKNNEDLNRNSNNINILDSNL